VRDWLLLLCLLSIQFWPVRASTYAEAIVRAQDFATLPGDGNLLTLDYPQLVTTNFAGTTYLKTLTLMKGNTWSNYYLPYVGATSLRSNGVGNEAWVTFEPELKGYLTARTNEFDVSSAASIAGRAEQALGMTNSSTHLFAVDLWVAADSLFRPTINWSPTNSATFRDWTGQDTGGPGWFAGAYAVNYYDWFTNRQQTVYAGSYAFPWTGLGYTFDWYYATNSPALVGPSEFVIGAQQSYYVAGGTPVDQFFAIPEPGIGALLLCGLALALGRRWQNSSITNKSIT
jgi:hypothetical protein